jgi:hypothetical protein
VDERIRGGSQPLPLHTQLIDLLSDEHAPVSRKERAKPLCGVSKGPPRWPFQYATHSVLRIVSFTAEEHGDHCRLQAVLPQGFMTRYCIPH